MIERSLKAYFRAHVTLDFAPEGVALTLDAPLADAIATDRAD